MLAAAAFLLLRRRHPPVGDDVAETIETIVPPIDMHAPPRAQIVLSLKPTRAGVNLLSATVEAEVTVENRGEAVAEDVRLAVRLYSAHRDNAAEFAGFYAEQMLRSTVPPFVLAPGEARAERIVTALPRDAIRAMTAADRPMFVPIVALNCLYATAGVPAQTAQAFAIGIERAGSAKLAPFWLDGPPRMNDQVAARPHADATTS